MLPSPSVDGDTDGDPRAMPIAVPIGNCDEEAIVMPIAVAEQSVSVPPGPGFGELCGPPINPLLATKGNTPANPSVSREAPDPFSPLGEIGASPL
jgi:hypothetical protein